MLFRINKFWNDVGSWLLQYLNIKIATCKVLISKTFNVLSLLNKGSEFARNDAPVHIYGELSFVTGEWESALS